MNGYEDYYHHPAENWTVAQCKKALKHVAKDGMGNPYPFKGMFPELKNGPVRYNGGTSRFADKWYQGEVFYLPILPPQFKWNHPSSWCWQIVLERDDK